MKKKKKKGQKYSTEYKEQNPEMGASGHRWGSGKTNKRKEKKKVYEGREIKNGRGAHAILTSQKSKKGRGGEGEKMFFVKHRKCTSEDIPHQDTLVKGERFGQEQRKKRSCERSTDPSGGGGGKRAKGHKRRGGEKEKRGRHVKLKRDKTTVHKKK